MIFWRGRETGPFHKVILGGTMKIKDQLAMQKMYADGAFNAAHDPVPETPEDIAGMTKDEVVGWIEAHGGKADRRKSVETLRDELTSIMFVEG